MPEKTKRWRGGRALLNDAGFHTTAAIVAEIEDTRKWPKGKDGDGYDLNSSWRCTPETTLQITDCDRKVTFEFDWDTKEARRNSYNKVERLVKVLTKFLDALRDEQERYEARMAEIEAAKAAEKDDD